MSISVFKKITAITLLLLFPGMVKGQKDNVYPFHKWALTPPMGWNSWDCFGPSVTEDEVKANADYMAANLKQYGWEYIVVDIRWYLDNQTTGHYNAFDNSTFIYDNYGRYLPSPTRFPSAANGAGFKPLADYIHSLGLKFGIHIMHGVPKVAVINNLPVKGTNITAADIYSDTILCTWLHDNYTVDADREGAQEYYNSIFDLYASWGVDFVKVDDLSRPYHSDEIKMIRRAIDQTGRPIVLSMSPGATPMDKHEHAAAHANMWRTVDDFWDNWSQLNYSFGMCAKWAPYIEPGAWPDADMLPLGKFIRGERATNRYTKFTEDEQYTLMTLWSIFKSPLMFGGNLPDNNDFTNTLITNDEVLNVHANSVDNKQWFNENDVIGWTADDPVNGDRFVAVFNVGVDGFVKTKDLLYRSGAISREVNSNKAIANTGRISRTFNQEGKTIEVDITGKSKLYLVVTDAGDNFNYDHADWINPAIYNDNGDSLLLTSLNWVSASSGWASVNKNKSEDGHTLTINGITYSNGFGVNSYSTIEYNLPEGYNTFKAFCGVDDEVLNAPEGVTVEFMVFTEDLAISSSDSIPVDLNELGFTDSCKIRDLWKKQDIGTFISSGFAPDINTHGAGLYRISALNRSDDIDCTLQTSSDQVQEGDSITLTVNVSLKVTAMKNPSGWIQLFQNDSVVATLQLDSTGIILFKTGDINSGKNLFRAHYGGNTIYNQIESNEVSVVKKRKY